MPRRGDYLYQRPGLSQNWYLRLQVSDKTARVLAGATAAGAAVKGWKVEKSLGTPDRAEAEIRAADEIKAHKTMLLFAKNLANRTIRSERTPEFEPNKEHVRSDGSRVYATSKELIVLDLPDGVQTEPNPELLCVTLATDPQERRWFSRNVKKKSHPDDAVIDTWIEHRGKVDYIADEAREVWRLFKEITGRKRLATCTRDDGRALARKLRESGNKSQTVAKKISHLRAAVNMAIDEGKLKFNPFSNVVPKADDQKIRLPFSDNDMLHIRDNLDKLSPQDQLVWIWLATTGMRLSECFAAVEEFEESGLRYVQVGTKNDSSYRPIPLTDAVISLLPNKIEGPVFADTSKNVGKRLNRFLDSIGIDDRKTVHSLRHRAKSLLSSLGCPEGVQYKILGHSDKNVGHRYLHVGIKERKFWLDKLGY